MVASIGTTEDTPSTQEDTGPAKKYKELEVTVKDGVQTIKLNRPKKYNAITWEVLKY